MFFIQKNLKWSRSCRFIISKFHELTLRLLNPFGNIFHMFVVLIWLAKQTVRRGIGWSVLTLSSSSALRSVKSFSSSFSTSFCVSLAAIADRIFCWVCDHNWTVRMRKIELVNNFISCVAVMQSPAITIWEIFEIWYLYQNPISIRTVQILPY